MKQALAASSSWLLLQLFVVGSQLCNLLLRSGLRGGHSVTFSSRLLLFLNQCIDTVLPHACAVPDILHLSH